MNSFIFILANINIIIFVIGLCIVFLFVRKKLTFWQRRGIPHIKLDFKDWLSMLKFDNYVNVYRKMAEYPRFCGCYLFLKPVLVIRDPDLIQAILVDNFKYFPEIISFYNNPKDLRSRLLINISGLLWKWSRKLYTPAFHSKRMKAMNRLILSSALKFNTIFKKQMNMAGDKFSIIYDKIGVFLLHLSFSGIYGLDPKENEEIFEKFVVINKSIRTLSVKARKSNGIIHYFPWSKLFKPFSIITLKNDEVEFFENLAQYAMLKDKEDQSADTDRIPYLNFVYEEMLQNDKFDENLNNVKEQKEKMAQVFPTCFPASALVVIHNFFYCILFELAKNQEIQMKLRKEIENELENAETKEEKFEGGYLDKVLMESFRKYPPTPGIQRVCEQTCFIPKFGLNIEKGTHIYISVDGIHNDPRFFKEPEKFDPHRFDNTDSLVSGSYIPFGLGPRRCLASAYSKMMLKNAIIGILTKYCLSIDKRNPSFTEVPNYLTPSNMSDITIIFSEI